jgi:hypothetical protein
MDHDTHWSAGRQAGWDDFVQARERFRRTLAAQAQIALLERLWCESGVCADAPQHLCAPPHGSPEANGSQREGRSLEPGM